MGNSKSCCLKASPSPSASPKLDRGSRHVKPKGESEVHEAAARDTGAVETVPATPKSESTSGALKRHHLKNTSAPVTPQGKKQQFPSALGVPLSSAAPRAPWEGLTAWGSSQLEPALLGMGTCFPTPAAFPLAAGCFSLFTT